MIEMALKMGMRPRVEIGSFEQAKPFIDMGVKDFCIGWDISIVAEWSRKQKAGLAELFPEGRLGAPASGTDLTPCPSSRRGKGERKVSASA